MTWISDRLPTAEDGDSIGDVCLHWKDRGDDGDPYDPHIHHTNVTIAMTWRRSDYWLPKELR